MYDLIMQKIDDLIKSSSLNTVAIAVSGGSDSMVLAHILNKYTHNNNIQLIGLIVNHNIRREAEAEAQQVANWLNYSGINNIILNNHQPIPQTGLSEYARDIRYNLLWDFCKKNHIKHLFVAHHYDDVLETVALRLEKSSKVFGLAGINAYKKTEHGYIVRPMLSINKGDILDYCKDNNIPYVNDPSNENTNYSRVRLRKKIMADKDFKNMLIATQRENLDNRQKIEKMVIKNLKKYTTQLPSGIVKIDMGILNLHQGDLYYTIRQIILWVSGDFSPPRSEKIDKIVNAIRGNNFRGLTLHRCIVKKIQNSLWIYAQYMDKQPLNNSQLYMGRYSVLGNVKDCCYIAPLVDSSSLENTVIDLPKTIPKAILIGIIGIFNKNGLLFCPNQVSKNHCNIRVLDNKWDLFYPSPFIS